MKRNWLERNWFDRDDDSEAGPEREFGRLGRPEDEVGRWTRGDYPGRQGYGGGQALAGQSFRGLGPKGYVRSDERLREDVCERLTDHEQIDASDITVEARQGVVTLTGTVHERSLKHRVEDLVENIPGVKDVENRLTVRGRSQQREGSEATGGDFGGSDDISGQPRH